MKRNKKIFSLTASVCFLHLFLQAQLKTDFIKHLSTKNLHREHSAYLDELAPILSADSIAMLKAKFFLQYGGDSLFFESFRLCRELFITDTCALAEACIYFLKKPASLRSKWFSMPHYSEAKLCESISLANAAAENPHLFSMNEFPVKIQYSFSLYKKLHRRKPLAGALLSAAVPGLGKLYAGRRNSFLVTLLSHAGFFAQSVEAAKRLGTRHPFTIFAFGFAGIFYISNIYGGYHAVKEVKKERKKQFLYDVSDYYYANRSCGLY